MENARYYRLAQKTFHVPDYGTVTGDNAVFTQFLHSMTRNRDGQPCDRDDLDIGEEATAVFQLGTGRNTITIRRVS